MDHLIVTPTDDLLTQQMDLELAMREAGKERFLKAEQKAKETGREDGTAYGSRILSALIKPVAKAVAEFVDVASTGKPGRRHAAVKLLQHLEPEAS